MDPQELNELGDFELTAEHKQAFIRLQKNKDFAVLCDVLSRWQIKRGLELLRSPHQGQESTLQAHQGGYNFFKRMLEYVHGTENPGKDLGS